MSKRNGKMIGGAIGDLEEINVDGRNTTSPKLRRYGALIHYEKLQDFCYSWMLGVGKTGREPRDGGNT